MALITCPECNGQVSDKAAACPHCGYPISAHQAKQKETEAEQPSPVPATFVVERIYSGRVYFRCQCGHTIEKPFSFVNKNSATNYTLNNNLCCPACHVEESAGAILLKSPEKSPEIPRPRYRGGASGVCPSCGKPTIQAMKKGFGFGEAAVGALILGPIGILGGAVGANEIEFVCTTCGHRWKK